MDRREFIRGLLILWGTSLSGLPSLANIPLPVPVQTDKQRVYTFSPFLEERSRRVDWDDDEIKYRMGSDTLETWVSNHKRRFYAIGCLMSKEWLKEFYAIGPI